MLQVNSKYVDNQTNLYAEKKQADKNERKPAKTKTYILYLIKKSLCNAKF